MSILHRDDEVQNEEITEETELQQPSGFDDADGKVVLNSTEAKLALASKLIINLKNDLSNLERLLASEAEPADLEQFIRRETTEDGDVMHPINEGKIVEGVFDGQNMIGSDGKLYMVPPNYASKSKLVEGDIMKLTIQPNGSFLYKQIGPIERQRVMGVLTRDEVTGDWKVIADGHKYGILTASVTYFKGQAGDDIVILIPKNAPSKWAAVENIIKRD
ncbi:MAG: hypothetical protein PHS79_02140 [Patescibacteria group bacterium]|nr:hypothetical protein [Patescibacteria group bacterium]